MWQNRMHIRLMVKRRPYRTLESNVNDSEKIVRKVLMGKLRTPSLRKVFLKQSHTPLNIGFCLSWVCNLTFVQKIRLRV